MFHIFWKAVGRLERYGFRVLGLTCDGLAANRFLFVQFCYARDGGGGGPPGCCRKVNIIIKALNDIYATLLQYVLI